ncbi:MAG: hypothetical protein FJ202_05130 [Gemmatimonadetes bacterium]|nr:hypothetical protein [Gemmatimonadota bacterium]
MPQESRLADATRQLRRVQLIMLGALTLSAGVLPLGLSRIVKDLSAQHESDDRAAAIAADAMPAFDAWIVHVRRSRQAERALAAGDSALDAFVRSNAPLLSGIESAHRATRVPDAGPIVDSLRAHWQRVLAMQRDR